MTIAAQIISEALGSPDLILGRDWLNRQTDATVRIVSVDWHEVNSITMDTCVQLRDPSAVMVVLDSKFSGGNTMEFKEERMLVNRGPEVLHGHTERPSETNEGIWFCLSVLNADWDNFVIAEQQSIEDRTTEINQWTVLEGTKLVRYLRDQQNPKITTERHQSIDESLVTAALDPGLMPRCRQRLMYFYAEFAEKTRDLQKKVSTLRNSMRLGLKGQGNSEDPAKRVLLNKIGPDYSGPNDKMSREDIRLTESNQIRNDGSQKGPCCGNHRQRDDMGSSRNSQAQSLVAPLNYQSVEREAREYTGESTFLPQNQKLTAYALEEAITLTARKDQALDLEDLPVPLTVRSRAQVVTQVEEAPVDSLRFFEALDGIDNHRQELMKFEALIRARKIGLELDALKAAKLTLEGMKHGAPPMTTRNIGLSPEDIFGDMEKESGIEAAMNHSELKGTEKRNLDELANSKLSSTPGSNPRLATGSLKALTTSRHFFDTPSDIGRHWKQLDVLERARKISMKEMAQQTEKLTMDKASYAPMPPIMNRMIGDNSKPPPGNTKEDLSPVNLLTPDLGTDFLETRMAGQGSIRKNSAEQIQLDLPKERLNSIGGCVLAAHGPEQAKARQTTELEVEQVKSNLETRRKARRVSAAAINIGGTDDEGQKQAPSKLNQTEPDMSNNLGGSAATALPPGVAVGLANGEHNASPPEISPDYHSAYFMGTNAVCPDGIHMSAVSTFARNISRDDCSTDGTRYDSVLRTVRIHPHGLHELLASSRVRSLPYDLAGLAKVDTLVFESCSIDRQYQMGNGTIFHPGHLVVTRNPCNNIEWWEGLQKLGRVLQPRHAMYPELQECIEMQKAALKADGRIGSHHPDDYVQPVGLFEFDPTKPQRYQEHRKLPNVQLETDFVRLHYITKGLLKAPCYVVRQVVPAQIREEGELGFGPVITQPGPNYAQQLINEVARQRRPERARVTVPLAHLDLIIRLSMEPVPDGELYEPNIFEREYQYYLHVLYQLQPMVKTEWAGLGYRPDKDVEERISTLPSRPVLQIQPHNRDQVHTLFIDNLNHFDMRPRNSDTEPDPIRIHIDDAMVDLPVSTALCERVPSTRQNADDTLNPQKMSSVLSDMKYETRIRESSVEFSCLLSCFLLSYCRACCLCITSSLLYWAVLSPSRLLPLSSVLAGPSHRARSLSPVASAPGFHDDNFVIDAEDVGIVAERLAQAKGAYSSSAFGPRGLQPGPSSFPAASDDFPDDVSETRTVIAPDPFPRPMHFSGTFRPHDTFNRENLDIVDNLGNDSAKHYGRAMAIASIPVPDFSAFLDARNLALRDHERLGTPESRAHFLSADSALIEAMRSQFRNATSNHPIVSSRSAEAVASSFLPRLTLRIPPLRSSAPPVSSVTPANPIASSSLLPPRTTPSPISSSVSDRIPTSQKGKGKHVVFSPSPSVTPPPPFPTSSPLLPEGVDPPIEDPPLVVEDLSRITSNTQDVPLSSSPTHSESLSPSIYAYIDLFTAIDEDISTAFDEYIAADSGVSPSTPVSDSSSDPPRIPARLKGKGKCSRSPSPSPKPRCSRRLLKSPTPPPRICNRCLPLLRGTVKMRNSKNTRHLAAGSSSDPSQRRRVRNVFPTSPLPVVERSPSIAPSPVSVAENASPSFPSHSPFPENTSTLHPPLPTSSSSTAIVVYPNISVTLWNINDRSMAAEVPMALQRGSDYTATNPPDLDSLRGTSLSELLLTRNTLFQASDAILDSVSSHYANYARIRQRVEYFDAVLRSRVSIVDGNVQLDEHGLSVEEVIYLTNILTARENVNNSQSSAPGPSGPSS
ncbi:hypothetical protein C8J56DRAFT_903004 [Mycena floridula]|nr:hypothetical protein C8J56DRAFT_903004 [Mycena floridula]